jgi:hypothetical protein
MVNASRHWLRRRLHETGLYDEQIIARLRPGVQRRLWQRLNMVSSQVTKPEKPKKRAAVSGGFEVDNREASNRVDRSHSVSKQGRFKS